MIFRFIYRKRRRPKAAGPLIDAWRAEAKASLVPRLRHLASAHGFELHRVAIKNNRTNWGSCSTKGNINLNLQLMGLPEHLRDYVMLHELCHLRHPDHGEDFHALLAKLLYEHDMPSERLLREEIKKYHTI